MRFCGIKQDLLDQIKLEYQILQQIIKWSKQKIVMLKFVVNLND